MKIKELLQDAEIQFRNHQAGQERVILDQWPAQEFFRCMAVFPPVDYFALWRNAGGKNFPGSFGDRMIALKNDPIWCRISKFNLPYPPFDKHGVMWIRDVDRTEAEKLGLILPTQKIAPEIRNWESDKKQIRLKRTIQAISKNLAPNDGALEPCQISDTNACANC